MQIQTVNIENCSDRLGQWQALVSREIGTITNPGISNTYDWIETLCGQHISHKDAELIIIEDKNKVVGIAPIYTRISNKLGISKRELLQIQEFYYTRSHLLVAQDDPEILTCFFNHLSKSRRTWTSLSFSTISGSENDIAIQQALKESSLKYSSQQVIGTPYIKLPDSPDILLNSRDKKFRYSIRSGIKKLEKSGKLRFEVFDKDAASFLRCVYEIERQSWKEVAGTSITQNEYQKQFYDLYTPKAAANGYLRGFVLFLNDEPISYNFGILFNHVYECLKTSYKESYKGFSLGHITYMRTFEHLINKSVKYFDFQGVKEKSKLKWTSSFYAQNLYTVYNSSISASIFYYAKKAVERKNFGV